MRAPAPWRRYGPASTDPRPVLRQGDPGIDSAWLRRRRLGEIGAALWAVTLPLLLMVGFASAWGPFGWAATWQLAVFGFNNPVWLVIPLMPLAFIPSMIARLARIDVDTPFLLGMRQSFDAKWGPRVEEEGGARAIFRRRRRGAGWIVVAGAAVLAVFAGKGWHDSTVPHAPLPELPYARLAGGATALPPAVRVTGAVSDRSREWAHAYTVRRVTRRDVYYPLRRAGGPASGRVALVEMSSASSHYETAVWNMVDPPGPREGLPTLLDEWTAGRLRAAGFALADRVVVLKRRQLDGRSPYPDPITDLVFAIIAGSVTLVAALAWWGARRGERRLAAEPRRGPVRRRRARR